MTSVDIEGDIKPGLRRGSAVVMKKGKFESLDLWEDITEFEQVQANTLRWVHAKRPWFH